MITSQRILRTASHSGLPARTSTASSKTTSLRSPPMSGMTFKQHESGYTMMELIMVVVIVAILAAIALPSFKYVTTSNRISSEVNGLLGDMQFARSEAIKEGLPVTVCSSTDGTSCAASANWQTGWIVFMDLNGDGARQGNESILRLQGPFAPGDTFVADNAAFTGATFNRMGYAQTHAAVTVTVLLHDSTNTSAWTRCLAITSVGLVTTQKAIPAQGNCI
jgi:type IV fimbrial biogenesis protein FimT